MKTRRWRWILVPAVLMAGGCATIPTGPSLMALPGSGKNFDQFRSDDGMCRQYAQQTIGGRTPNQTAVESGVVSAAVGTAVGAAAGAAMGGRHGAETGAGVGLLAGGLMGAESGRVSGYEAQRRYDASYTQCMYAQGHQVPVSGYGMMSRGRYGVSPPLAMPPPAREAIPPPPPGLPPAPPPDMLPR